MKKLKYELPKPKLKATRPTPNTSLADTINYTKIAYIYFTNFHLRLCSKHLQ